MRSKIKLQTLTIFLILFPHFKPESLAIIAPKLETCYDVGRLISVVIFLCLVLAEKKRPSPAALLFILLESWIIVTTALFNSSRLVGALINCSSVAIVFWIIEYYARRSPEDLIQALMANLGWIVIVNLITVLLYYPDGMHTADGTHADYFLGQKNALITLILPACTVALLAFCKGHKLRASVILAAGIVPIVIVWCATSIVGLLMAGMVLLLGVYAKKIRLRPTVIWIVTLIADVMVTILRVVDRPGPLNTFITQVLHKNTTLTGRTDVWDTFYGLFFAQPVTGYGYRKYIVVGNETFFHAHNTYFQFLLLGGVVALLLFLLFNIAVLQRVERLPSSRVKLIAVATMSAVYVMHLAESENSIMSAVVLSLANSAEPIAVWLDGPDAGCGFRLPEPEPEAEG